MMIQDVREKMADLTAAGHTSDPTNIIISLFHAYNTTTNKDFCAAKVWTTPAELMYRPNAKYMELCNVGMWGKRSAKDNQIIWQVVWMYWCYEWDWMDLPQVRMIECKGKAEQKMKRRLSLFYL